MVNIYNMEGDTDTRRRRKKLCVSCTILLLTITNILVGFSLIGTAAYEEALCRKFRAVTGDTFLRTCYVFLGVGANCLLFSFAILSVACCQKQYVGAAILTLLALFSFVATAAMFITPPWLQTSTLVKEAKARYGLGPHSDVTREWDRIEDDFKCCTKLRLNRECGPMAVLTKLRPSQRPKCTEMIDRLAGINSSRQIPYEACDRQCEEQLSEVLKMVSFSTGFQAVVASLIQIVGVFFIWITAAKGYLHLRNSRNSGSIENPWKCKLSCDLFGKMCTCGCACLDNVRSNVEDSIPFTPQEHPPPYSPPIPSTVNDLIDLDILGDQEQTDTNRMEQTRL